MKKLNLKKIILMGLISTSILAVTSIGASAEWRQDGTGYWYSNGNSYSKGWSKINGWWYYFDNNGYMKTGWLHDNGNWYYLKKDGSMVASLYTQVPIEGRSSIFAPDGRWMGYYEDKQSTTTNNTNSNTSTINSTTNKTTTTSDSFTFEDAKAEVMRTMTEGFYGGYIIPYDKIEVTKGGYNGFPVEDKIYNYTDNILGKTFTYRIVGIIDKTTGFFAGTATVFKDMEFWEANGRGDYELYTDSRNPNVKINQKTFDKKGDWITIGYEPIYTQTTALTAEQKLKRQQEEEANIKAMHPDWVTH